MYRASYYGYERGYVGIRKDVIYWILQYENDNIENENIENEIKSHGCGFLWKFQRTLNANKLTKG